MLVKEKIYFVKKKKMKICSKGALKIRKNIGEQLIDQMLNLELRSESFFVNVDLCLCTGIN